MVLVDVAAIGWVGRVARKDWAVQACGKGLVSMHVKADHLSKGRSIECAPLLVTGGIVHRIV